MPSKSCQISKIELFGIYGQEKTPYFDTFHAHGTSNYYLEKCEK